MITTHRPHLGDALSTAGRVTSTVGSGVAITAGAIQAGLVESAALSAAIPIIGVAIAGVTLAIGLLMARKGPKQKRATTAIVNDIEPHLQANKDAYFAGARTVSARQQALNNFDAGWAYLIDQCGIEQMGEPGYRCIEDRMAAGQLQPSHNGLGPWTGNGKWNWFAYYRDPIERDVPNPDPATETGGQYTLSIDPVTGQTILVPATDYTPWLLGGAAAIMLAMAVSE